MSSSSSSPAAAVTDVSQIYDTILILDFGSQLSHLIARRVRELGVYCELVACTHKVSDSNSILKASSFPAALTLSTTRTPRTLTKPTGTLMSLSSASANGLQEIAHDLGGQVVACEKKEYGKAEIEIVTPSLIFEGLTQQHGLDVTAKTSTAPLAAVQHTTKKIYGIQFHPEVTHTPQGALILSNFVLNACGLPRGSWSMASFVDTEIARIRGIVGPTAEVIGAVSGGVDSTVAAKLLSLAIGDRFHAVLVDNGVMRLNECRDSVIALRDKLGVNITLVDSSELFLGEVEGRERLSGILFIEVFEEEAANIEKRIEAEGRPGKVEFLLQGTLYPDVIESVSFKGPSATIKTHHNVGGLLANMKLKLIEPLRELFKDEVRALGELLGIDHDLVWRHPFPGPGIAIRVLGEVTKEQVEIARKADFIYIEEIKKAGLYKKISQAYAALLPVKAVGVMGDARTYEQVIALRAVETTDFMTADWFEFPYDVLKKISSRIINEVNGVNRVVYDVSSKPPATIEWE
ncbi:hypothetical protein BC829DRAFT_384665 [Chytridium lagenaria]|nr:hypothetical protein BC829DRAFT_384665 [Chytridium lagenaria]